VYKTFGHIGVLYLLGTFIETRTSTISFGTRLDPGCSHETHLYFSFNRSIDLDAILNTPHPVPPYDL